MNKGTKIQIIFHNKRKNHVFNKRLNLPHSIKKRYEYEHFCLFCSFYDSYTFSDIAMSFNDKFISFVNNEYENKKCKLTIFRTIYVIFLQYKFRCYVSDIN